MKIRIQVTKEILNKSKACDSKPGENCAIALAVREIFPAAHVGYGLIYPFLYRGANLNNQIGLPNSACDFISQFDHKDACERMRMKPFSFDIEVPDSVIEKIGLSQVHKILSESKTLEYVPE